MADKRVNSQSKKKGSTSLRIRKGLLMIALLLLPLSAIAQSSESTAVAKTVTVADSNVSYGDVVLYDAETNLYRLSNGENDPRFYGIIVEEPTLLVETENNMMPVVESGFVSVNVTLENGEIAIGDPISTSSVPGKAMRTDLTELNIFGFAVEALTEEDAIQTVEDGPLMGTILVEVGGERLRAHIAEHAGGAGSSTGNEENSTEENLAIAGAVMRFGFASIVALGAIFLIFSAFLTSIKHGVISVGRNPRAEATIRSMVILNVVLAIVITAAAIFFAISLLVVES